MKKSYHSNAVPADEAMMTRAIDQALWCGCSANVAMTFPSGEGIAARLRQSSLRMVPSARANLRPNLRASTWLESVRPSGWSCICCTTSSPPFIV